MFLLGFLGLWQLVVGFVLVVSVLFSVLVFIQFSVLVSTLFSILVYVCVSAPVSVMDCVLRFQLFWFVTGIVVALISG